MASGEDHLIERIRRRIPSAVGAELRLGIGDDAAVIRPAHGKDWVISSDQFIENIHFLVDRHPPEVVGYKALARATSDLAAMGARPRLFLLSLALPIERTGHWLDRMLSGMAWAARRFGLRLAGGDTARSVSRPGIVAFDLTVLGDVKAGRAVGRRGARPGDAVFVSGRLGAAQLGLELGLRGSASQRRWRRLLAAHYYPSPAIELGEWLGSRRLISSMMDLSDGLSTDLDRLCKASGVGAFVHEEKIPAVTMPPRLQKQGFDARRLALHGGEDYGLLFTVSKRLASRMPRAFRGTRVTRIGEIVHGRGVTLVSADGSTSDLAPQGWDHFRRSTKH